MGILYIDLETIPSQDPEYIQECRDSIRPPANYKLPESINKWVYLHGDAEADKKHRLTSFDGLHGEIISIAWAIDDGSVCTVSRDVGESEVFLLTTFFQDLEDAKDANGNRVAITKWVGHYISGFDARFLWQRAVINRAKPSVTIPYDAKPWKDSVFDTKVAWTGESKYSGAGSLDALSKAFGLDGKGDMDGSKVYDYWLAGKIEEIAEYNRHDVELCRELYKRMNFLS